MIKYLLAYRFAFLGGLATTLALVFMHAQKTWSAVGIASLALGAILFTIILSLRKRFDRLPLSLPLFFLTLASFVLLTSLIEHALLHLAVSIAGGMCMAILIGGALVEGYHLRRHPKRWRRILVILWGYNMYACTTMLFALVFFFTSIPSPFFALSAALLGAYVSSQIWNLYLTDKKKILFWSLALGLLVFELFFISVRALPFGYLALGLLTVWAWYVLTLMVRFHLSREDIVWAKQRFFLGANVGLYFLVLFFFIRWF